MTSTNTNLKGKTPVGFSPRLRTIGNQEMFRVGEIVYPREEHTNLLSNTKLSDPKTNNSIKTEQVLIILFY